MVGAMELNNRQYPSNFDIYLFHEGTLFESYKMLGAHILNEDDIQGVRFAVWAPNARQVSVVGDFNNWNGNQNQMERLAHLVSGFYLFRSLRMETSINMRLQGQMGRRY